MIAKTRLTQETENVEADDRLSVTKPGEQKNKPDLPKLLLTESEAAHVLNVSKRLLWTLNNQGLIDCVRLGNAKRYTYASLERFIQDQDDKSTRKRQ